MKKLMQVACLQMNSTDRVEQNLEFVAQQMALANEQDVQMLLLPENFAQMPMTPSALHIELAGCGQVQDFLAAQARQYEMILVAGSVPVLAAGEHQPFARSLVFDAMGVVIASYDKIHLYDVDLPNGQVYRESATYLPGPVGGEDLESANLVVVQTTMVKLGLSICYDLRFPEMYRRLVERGAQILTVPSAFTYETGQAHWQTLLQARAIENQCFVLAAAQTGTHANGRQTWGNSMIIDPWGKVINVLCDSTGLVIAEIDLTKLTELRTNFPALQHRRIH